MSMMRSRWAAIGAAVAVSLGAGGIGLVRATSPAGASAFVPVTPCRVVDTRPEYQVGPKSSPLGPGETLDVTAVGTSGECDSVPNSATGVALNVTTTDATLPTFLTIWEAGQIQPNASSLNPSPGQPPTPNAVTTGINGDGEFSIYNLQGSVHVLVDIVGYYTDHNHDDRYYTKGQANSRYLSSSTWSIFIPPAEMEASGTTWPDITFASGVSALGMAFNDGVFGRVHYGFRLPDHYVAGTDVAVRMRYLAVSGFGAPVFPCDSAWWSNGPYIHRADAATTFAGTTWEEPRGFDTSATRLTSTQQLFDDNIISETTMTIDGTNLLPGDQLNLTLNRDAGDSDDTCEGMMVTGLLIEPAG